MPDELPPAGTEAGVVETPPATETPAPEVAEAPVTESEGAEVEITEDKEPGGSTPQDVYRRKLYREAKRAKEEAQREREQRIAAEARARALEEQATKPKEQPRRIYTVAEVEDLVEAGEVTRKDAEVYKQAIIVPNQLRGEIDRREQVRRQGETAQRLVQKAAEAITEYVQLIPSLADDSDPNTQSVGLLYRRLINERGYADNLETKRLAIELSHGPIEKLRKQREVSELTARGTATHAALPAGGNPADRAASDAVNKVPKEMVDYWRSQGATEDQVKKYAQHHLSKAARRKANLGV